MKLPSLPELVNEPIAYAIYDVYGNLQDVKPITDPDWRGDAGILGSYWGGNEPLYRKVFKNER